jgi:(3S)-linalool synthase
MSYLQRLTTRNIEIEKLALAEFQLNKVLHQMEMQEVKRYKHN